MPINGFLYPGAKVPAAFEVANSLRFDDGSSDYLSRTPSSDGNRKVWTWSCWLKRSTLGTWQSFFASGDGTTTNRVDIIFTTSDQIQFNFDGGLDVLITDALYRDTSAWYHIVASVDTTQATASNRMKLYVNGEQITSFNTSVYPDLNKITTVNSTNLHVVGARYRVSPVDWFFDGYMAEAVLIDGQQLDPTSFGEFDEDTGIWKPIDVSGLTFGTNGFYLDFENSGSLGADVSGNGNNFTVNNLTSIDQTTDTPTNNFATINPLHFGSSNVGTVTMSQGNTIFSNSGSDTWRSSTIAVSQGKWYAEFKTTGTASAGGVGINNGIQTGYIGSNSYDYIYGFNGIVYNNDVNAGGSFTAPSTNDIIGVALDLDNNKIYWSLNGTFMNSGDPTSGATGTGAISISSSNPSGFYHFAVGDAGTGTVTFECNFGNPAFSISSGNSDANGYGNFEYAVPSGYYALNTKNLAEYG
jgi:hypothetical protein